MIIKASRNTPEVLQPGKESFDLPAPLVTAQRPPVLGARLFAVALMWCNHLNALLCKLLVQPVTVIGFVANQVFWSLFKETLLQSVQDKGDFMRRSTRCVEGERKTSSVCHCHELRALAPLGLSHPAPPFLATMKVPSMKHSLKSSSPRSLRSWAKASSTQRNTPERAHCWNLRWQVWYGGKRGGKSCQRAPLLKIHSTPLSTSRLSRQGRPRPSARRGGSGISGPMMVHCSSVSSSPRLFAMLKA